MILAVDGESPVPPFEQVRAQLASLITSGDLPTGTRLPTVRRLAGDLALAVNTVARAYRELETGGLVRTEGRRGTFVAARTPSLAEAELAARAFRDRVRQLGIPTEEALTLVRATLASEAH